MERLALGFSSPSHTEELRGTIEERWISNTLFERLVKWFSHKKHVPFKPGNLSFIPITHKRVKGEKSNAWSCSLTSSRGSGQSWASQKAWVGAPPPTQMHANHTEGRSLPSYPPVCFASKSISISTRFKVSANVNSSNPARQDVSVYVACMCMYLHVHT